MHEVLDTAPKDELISTCDGWSQILGVRLVTNWRLGCYRSRVLRIIGMAFHALSMYCKGGIQYLCDF